MAFSLHTIVSNLLSDQEDWRQRLVKEWPSLVGDLHKHMRFEKQLNDTVVIGVYQIHWMQELHMLTPLILATINEKLGGTYIKKLRFVVVNKSESIKKTTSKCQITDSHVISLNADQKNTLEKVKDPELQLLLSKLLHRCSS